MSHFYFNGTQLDTFDGTKGTIVTTFSHDTSTGVAPSAVDVARADGSVLRSFRTTAKELTVTGTVIGTSQADFEQRLDALKALLATPNGALKVTDYGTLDHRISCFEEGEDWVRSYVTHATVDDGALWDFTNYRIGRRSLILEATTTSGAKAATWTATHDLSAFAATDTVKLWAYVADATKLTSVRIRFETTAGSAYYEKTWTGCTTGWNELTALRSAFSTTGSPSWASIADIELTVTATGTDPATVSFDDLRFSTTAEDRTYTATLSGPLQLERQPFNVYWVPFSATFTVPDGKARSSVSATRTDGTTTTTQRWLPRYLSGSGPQPLALRATAGSMLPATVRVTDHFADQFGSYVGRYQTSVATFEATETWSAGAADTVNKKVGTQGRKLSPGAGATVTADSTISSTDYSALANTARATLWVYVADATNFGSIDVQFHTTAGAHYYTANVTGLGTGWNLVRIQKKSFTASGSPNWNAITQLTVAATAAGGGGIDATFDDWRWVDGLNATGGNYTATTGMEIAEVGAYRTCLALLDVSSSQSAVVSNTSFSDGEIIALISHNVNADYGVVARASYAASPFSGSYVKGSTASSTLTLGDSTSLSLVQASVNTVVWRWIRLVCVGRSVTLYGRRVTEDVWTKVAEGTTDVTGAGSWGLWTTSTALTCSSLEVIDYARGQTHSLAASMDRSVAVSLDGAAGTVTVGSAPGVVAGSLPTLRDGFNEGAVLHDGGRICTTSFYDVATDTAGWTSFGATGSRARVAIPFSSGSSTYLRQRGTFTYLAHLTSAAPTQNVTVRIETDSAGAPSGTLVDAGATCTISKEDVTAQIASTSSPWNGGVVPIELVWSNDLPVTASTTYWLVLKPVSVEATNVYAIPYRSDTGSNDISTYNTTGPAWSTSSNTGYVRLVGNVSNGTVTTPWGLVSSTTPTYL